MKTQLWAPVNTQRLSQRPNLPTRKQSPAFVTPTTPVDGVYFGTSEVLTDAREVLAEIIQAFAVYELGQIYGIKPDGVEVLIGSAEFESYCDAKAKELEKHLPLIKKVITSIRENYQVSNSFNTDWKLQMTLEEAEAWAKDSTFQGMLYHLTSGKKRQAVEKNGFSLYHTTSGALAYFTKQPEIIANMKAHRLDYTQGDPAVVYAKLNISHPLYSYHDFLRRYGGDLNPLMQEFPVFWNIDKYQVKAERLVMGLVLNKAGIRAVECPYRGSEDGEIMVMDHNAITLIKRPHDKEIDETLNGNGDTDHVSLMDYIPFDKAHQWVKRLLEGQGD